LEHLLGSIGSATRAKIEVGAYWLDSAPASASASLGARIRAEGPLLWTNSDSWEAAFCITGNGAGSNIDVFAFPFLRGCVIHRDGPLEDIARDHEVEAFWLQYADRRWIERGWSSPEGTGEWDHVRRPGTAFFRGIRCQSTKERFGGSEQRVISVDRADHGRSSLGAHASLPAGAPTKRAPVTSVPGSLRRGPVGLAPWCSRAPATTPRAQTFLTRLTVVVYTRTYARARRRFQAASG